MGALHEGHASLVRESIQKTQNTVVSIFVNPTQFLPGEDYEKYPRTFDSDCQLLSSLGVEYLFAPHAHDMYQGSSVKVVLPEISSIFEGEFRPGHFDGVATIVLKLFEIVRPTSAFFGLKDLQQCAVIEQMSLGLNLDLELHFCPTIRLDSGLALSSRNQYLNNKELNIAPHFYKTLLKACHDLKHDNLHFHNIIQDAKSTLKSLGFVVDYVEFVDRKTMQISHEINEALHIIGAVKLGAVRLIDNIQVLST